MDTNRFLLDRRDRWQRLTTLLDQVERRGVNGLRPQQIDELFRLYRLVSSDLNFAQTHTGNPSLLEYLEGLVGRAYAVLAVPRRGRPLHMWWRIVRHDFPHVMRVQWRLLLTATLATVLGVVSGFMLTWVQPDTADVFIGAFQGHLSETPAQRVQRLEAEERAGHSPIDSVGEHAVFTTYLFTHNIRVTVLCFALGLTFGIGTTVLLFYNGVILGSLAAMYATDGVMTFFIAWVGPHGSIELPCVIFGATAGLMLARAQWNRRDGSSWLQIRRMRRQLVAILIATASLLVVAGTIEGGFSQINEPTIPYVLKIAVAGILFAALIAYLFFMPIDKRPLVTTDANASDADPSWLRAAEIA